MKLVLETLHVFDTSNKVVENFISYKSYVDDFLLKSIEHIQKLLTIQKLGLISYLAEFG